MQMDTKMLNQTKHFLDNFDSYITVQKIELLIFNVKFAELFAYKMIVCIGERSRFSLFLLFIYFAFVFTLNTIPRNKTMAS